MSSSAPRAYAGIADRLKYKIHRFHDLLDIEGTFRIDDLEHLEADRDAIRLLAENGAIENVDKVRPPNTAYSRSHINIWRWNEEYQKCLKEYWERTDTLPCGHRVNITNSRKVPSDKLSCRYCNEQDEYPEYEKGMVEELL